MKYLKLFEEKFNWWKKKKEEEPIRTSPLVRIRKIENTMSDIDFIREYEILGNEVHNDEYTEEQQDEIKEWISDNKDKYYSLKEMEDLEDEEMDDKMNFFDWLKSIDELDKYESMIDIEDDMSWDMDYDKKELTKGIEKFKKDYKYYLNN